MFTARPYGAAVADVREITSESVTGKLSFRLRQLVGTGRPWSYQRASNETGIDVRTLKAYVQGAACPNLAKYKRLLGVLGPAIGTELNEMKGWLPRSERVPPEALDLDGLLAALSRAIDVLGGVAGPLRPPAARLRMQSMISAVARAGHGRPAAPDSPHVETSPSYRRPLGIHRIDTKAVVERLAYRLSRMIGQGRGWSLAAASDATCIDRRTLQSYVNGTACPNLARYIRLGHALGPEIGVELAYMIGWEPRHGSAPIGPELQLLQLRDVLVEAERAVEAVLDDRTGGRLASAAGGSELDALVAERH